MDFKPAEFMQRESFGPEALSCTVGIELNVDVHDFGLFLLVAALG